MWAEALKVAIVGFSVVFAGLWMLALGVKIMSFFCKLTQKRRREVTDDANIRIVSGDYS